MNARMLTNAVAAALALSVFASDAALAADRPEPTVRTLLDRPDLRPARVTVNKTFRFGGGSTVQEGAELAVVEVKRETVVLDTGEFLFEAQIEETDLLERTAALIASLSDDALAVTYGTLPDQQELWPTHVELTVDIRFGDGTALESGERVTLRGFDRGRALLFSGRAGFLFDTEADGTDVLARARLIAEQPEDARRPWFSRSLEAALAGGVEDADPVLAGVDYILVFRGSSACSRCARFQPKLRRAYEKLRDRHDNFEVVYVPDDPNANAARAYAEKSAMPWPVVDPAQAYAAANTRPNSPARILLASGFSSRCWIVRLSGRAP
jgi:hypothetical protein